MTQFDQPTTLYDACTHPKVTHRHGTYSCYVQCGCRCTDCSRVTVAYRAWENKTRAYATANPTVERFQRFVDASTARAHVERLRAAGLGSKEIARRAHVAASVVGALVWETPSRGRKVRERIRASVRDRILEVPVPGPEAVAPGHNVPAMPSANRVRALHHLGYSQAMLAEISGLDHQRIRRVVAYPDALTLSATHVAIAALYDKLRHTVNEPTEHRTKAAAARSRNTAVRNGWPTPLQLGTDGLVLAVRAALAVVPDDAAARKGAVDLNHFVFLIKCRTALAEACALAGAASLNHVALAARREGRRDVLALLEQVAA